MGEAGERGGGASAPSEPPTELGETGTAHREEESGVRLHGWTARTVRAKTVLGSEKSSAGLGGQGMLPGGGGSSWALETEKSVDNHSQRY